MIPDSIFELATRFAKFAHAGQFRRDGTAYILHPYRVAGFVQDHELKILAILHDVVEDSAIHPRHLLRAGIPRRIVCAVRAISKRSHETYEEYIKRCAGDRMARVVKIFDLVDNLVNAKHPRRYEKALSYLLSLEKHNIA